MRLFSKHLYHGTPHAFDKFDTEHIGTGEGAQVHGWGLYFAENKDVAKHYANYLSNSKIKISIDGKEIIANNKSELIDELKKLSVPEFIIHSFENGTDENFDWNKGLFRFIERMKDKIEEDGENANEEIFIPIFGGSITRLEALKKAEETLSWVNKHNFSIGHVTKLITVEIPDDLIFAEEDKSINEQPKQVIEAINQIADDVFTLVRVYQIPNNIHTNKDIETIMRKYIPSDEFRNYSLDNIFHTFNDWYDNYDYDVPPDINLISKHLDTIGFLWAGFPENINWKDMASDILDYANQYRYTKRICRWDSFEEFYDDYSSVGSPKETSLKLESLGVNGIHYDGRQDGSCYVIFNPNHIKIVEVE